VGQGEAVPVLRRDVRRHHLLQYEIAGALKRRDHHRLPCMLSALRLPARLAFLGRELPSLRSLASLLVLMAGAAGYVLSDREFKMQGFAAYTWVTAYFLIISVEMCYGKLIVGPHVGLKSMWGPTMYTNVLAILPMATAGLLAHEQDRLATTEWNSSLVILLGVSCAIGVAISYTGWNCRSMITATCYTVLGVANKMATVLMNCLIWDNHASLMGIGSLCVCLAGAASYQQAPVRTQGAAAPSLSSLCRNPIGPVFLLIILGTSAGATCHSPQRCSRAVGQGQRGVASGIAEACRRWP